MTILGTGSALPARVVRNDDLAAFLDTNDECISTRTGIRERRVLTDETLDFKKKFKLVFKEIRVGLFNGVIIGGLSFTALGLYIHFIKGRIWTESFLMAGCAGVSLVVAMLIASAVGTLVPLFFKKIKIDPAVASGPLITSINDLVAVVTYYGLCWVLLIELFRITG